MTVRETILAAFAPGERLTKRTLEERTGLSVRSALCSMAADGELVAMPAGVRGACAYEVAAVAPERLPPARRRDLIETLRAKGPMTITELCQAYPGRSQHMRVMLTQCTKRGLVVRHPGDGSLGRYGLTPAGEAWVPHEEILREIAEVRERTKKRPKTPKSAKEPKLVRKAQRKAGPGIVFKHDAEGRARSVAAFKAQTAIEPEGLEKIVLLGYAGDRWGADLARSKLWAKA